MNTQPQDILIDVLIELIESVTDEPKRVLFKGVSDLYEPFCIRLQETSSPWQVRITKEGENVVTDRNDTSIPVLIVFYQDSVRERESLNAFRQFTEDTIAEVLVRHLINQNMLQQQVYERIHMITSLVYPSIHRLAEFLLCSPEQIGTSLPLLGLFHDPELSNDLTDRQWNARIQDNYNLAVIRWRDFLTKARRNQHAYRALGERIALLHKADTDPSAKESVLQQIRLDEALRAINPPTRLIGDLMKVGMQREEAEELVRGVKKGNINPDSLPPSVPSLPQDVLNRLKSVKPKPKLGDEHDDENDNISEYRVNSCMEGVLLLAKEIDKFPSHFCIARTDTDEQECAEFVYDHNTHTWQVTLTPRAARVLSVPSEGASDVRYRIFTPQDSDHTLFYFSLLNVTSRLEPFAEIWLNDDFWNAATEYLKPEHQAEWHSLQQAVSQLRDIVDPDWKHEQDEDEDESEADREPNDPIYQIFDLLYLANRDVFEQFFDAWLCVATQPWRADVVAHFVQWREAVAGLLDLGLAESSDGASIAVLPYAPLRLAWHRAVLQQTETWLQKAVEEQQPVVFAESVLNEHLQVKDRPHVLFSGKNRLVEVSTAPFYSIFVPEQEKRRTRATLAKAQQKVDQFGRMWGFSLSRLHVAFQPSDAGESVYQLITKHAKQEPDAAFRVRAVVEQTGDITEFDRYLHTTNDSTTDLLTQEYHENMLPRVDYAKGALHSSEGKDNEPDIAAHIALLVDAFRETSYGFEQVVGSLNVNPHWNTFQELVQHVTDETLEKLKQVDLNVPPYHSGPMYDNRRDIVYVPWTGGQPEYLHLLVDSLVSWQHKNVFGAGAAYYERVTWDMENLKQLHQRADWVVLFDRTLDRLLFEDLKEANIRLIDYYPNLPGGYQLSVSSRRTEAVLWQLVQVLQQFFGDSELDFRTVAESMLDNLAAFASGLLLKTLGGGSLAQELLGLYATYLSLKDEDMLDPQHDCLIPLDDYAGWFGQRTQSKRRADLLVLKNPAPDCLEMLVVESKWYKQAVGQGFVQDEFGERGQLRTTVENLYSLFNPHQKRLDRGYWQRTLSGLLEPIASEQWQLFKERFPTNNWRLRVDGLVYVHQYVEREQEKVTKRAEQLHPQVAELLQNNPVGDDCFWRVPAWQRLKLTCYPDLVELFGGV